MASADCPDDPAAPYVLPAEFGARMSDLTHAIDNVLVAGHALKGALKEGHLPFSASLADGVRRYGPGPVFELWQGCRAIEVLRAVWTGGK